jgi:hypothetical protein
MISTIFSRFFFGIERRLGEQERQLGRIDAQLVVDGVRPQRLEVVPVGDDAVLDRILDRQDAALRLRLVAHKLVAIAHADHHALKLGPADDRRKDGARQLLAGVATLEHAGAVVEHHCRLVGGELVRGGGRRAHRRRRHRLGGGRHRGGGGRRARLPP